MTHGALPWSTIDINISAAQLPNPLLSKYFDVPQLSSNLLASVAPRPYR